MSDLIGGTVVQSPDGNADISIGFNSKNGDRMSLMVFRNDHERHLGLWNNKTNTVEWII